MIRVLQYGMGANLGGIETFLFNLARTIDASQFQFDFVYSDQGRPPVFAGDLPRSRFFGVTPRRVDPWRNRRDLDKLFTEEPFDILHFHAVTASYTQPVKRATAHGVRVVVHSHGSGVTTSRRTWILHQANRSQLSREGVVPIAVSREAGRWMFGHSPFEIIHNGIDVASFEFSVDIREVARRELGLGPDALAVGFVGALLPVKNPGFALRVFKQIRAMHPGAVLLLVGEGPLESSLRRQAEELAIADKVQFLGRRTDVPALLTAMDRLIMPSLHEGFPMAALEAQASGLPCLLSDAITAEVVLSPSCQRVSLAAPVSEWAARTLAASPCGRDRGAQAVLEAGYTVGANAQAVSEVYRTLLAEGPPPGLRTRSERPQ